MIDEYTAVVARGVSGYLTIYKPGSEMLASDGDTVTLVAVTADSYNRKWRVFVPPGAKVLQSTFFTYASPPETKVLLRMHQPPVGGVADVTAEKAVAVDIGTVLQQLLAGKELPFFSPASAGNVKLSDGARESGVITDTGGWVYINALQTPGDKTFELSVRITCDQAMYEAWYWSTTWDAMGNPVEGVPVPVVPPKSHEARVYEAVKAAGLVGPLSALSGGLVDNALKDAVLKTGVWAALLRLVP